jgi:hypothetical protein
MWTPRHAVTAREIGRVLRSGGRCGVANWTPEGSAGEFLRTMGAHLPEGPGWADPPPLWGSEDHVEGLFADLGVELEFEQREVVWEFRFGRRGRGGLRDEARPGGSRPRDARATCWSLGSAASGDPRLRRAAQRSDGRDGALSERVPDRARPRGRDPGGLASGCGVARAEHRDPGRPDEGRQAIAADVDQPRGDSALAEPVGKQRRRDVVVVLEDRYAASPGAYGPRQGPQRLWPAGSVARWRRGPTESGKLDRTHEVGDREQADKPTAIDHQRPA